jgi:hypothetical protein
LAPEVGSSYDIDLVLDGVPAAFSCTESDGGWSVTNLTGSAPVVDCGADGFHLEGTPESVEISVNAQDGSWRGAVNESPTYDRYYPNGPRCDSGCQVAELTVPKQ